MLEGVLLFFGFLFFIWAIKRSLNLYNHRDLISLISIFVLVSHGGMASYFSLYYSGDLVHIPDFFGVIIPLLFIVMPGGYVIMQYGTGKRPTVRDLLHVVPFLVSIVFMYPVWSMPTEEKINRIISDYQEIFPYCNFGPWIFPICLLYFVFYIFLEVYPMLINVSWKKLLSSGKANSNLFAIILIIRLLVIVLVIGLYIGVNKGLPLWFMKLVFIGIYLTVFAHAIYTLIYPYLLKLKFINTDFSEGFDFLKKSRQVNTTQVGNLEKNLNILMSKKKVFKNEKLSIAKLAEYAGVSPRTLSDYLNIHMEISFSEYMTGYRIEEARRLFQETDMTIAEITYECGFNSASIFYDRFKNKTGLSPAQYRKKYLSDSCSEENL